MTAQHTPGPWEWAEDRSRGGYSGLTSADGREVLFPQHCNDGDESVSESDARLIAAAPELLAALMDLRDSVHPHAGGHHVLYGGVDALDAVIAKATGGAG